MSTIESWPFEDPRNLATFTVAEILSGAEPILFVSHDVEDGAWQFLPSEQVNSRNAKVVCLEDIVELDKSLRELADLPLGWTAERRSRELPWRRSPVVPTNWQELSEKAYEYTENKQEQMQAEFAFRDFDRYDYNQGQASLTFSIDGIARLRTRIQIIGSTSKASGTWLWSWANSSVLEGAAEGVHLLQKFGSQHGFERLSSASWPAEEVDAWEVTAIACFLLAGSGVYRAPDANGALYMVLSEPEVVAVAERTVS